MRHSHRYLLPSTVVAACLLASSLALATPGVVVRKAELRDNTSFSARVLKRVQPGTSVTLKKRRGGWQQVSLGDTVGWVRIYQVRAGKASTTTVQAANDSSRGVLSDLASWSRGASGLFGSSNAGTSSSQTTATVGIRGLSAKDLDAAKPDKQELKKLKGYGVKAKTAKSFAKQVPLKRRKVKFIEED